MELTLYRRNYTLKSTIGELFIDGKYFCFTLEDTCRDKNRDGDLKDDGEGKIFAKTAIPSGRYQVILSMSNRFKVVMPEVLNVEGYAGIRMHPGNTDIDTHGCILVGKTKSTDFIGNSKETYRKLFIVLSAVSKKEKIFLTIKDLI